MKISNKMVKLVQEQLNQKYNLSLEVDGWSGPATIAGIQHISAVSSTWSDARKFVGAIQYFATQAGFNAGPIDGYWGEQTAHGYEDLVEFLETGKVDNWRDELEANEPQFNWPRGTTDDMNRFYGPVGQNMSKVNTPYTLKLAWAPETTLNRFTCHQLVVEPIQAAMEEILDVYGLDFIKENKLDFWGGCLNVRAIRGGTRYSTHSWGSSLDWNPTENRHRWKSDKAQLARAEFIPFWEAWERQGAQSLGRAKNYDWMHVGFNT
jgi:hypothetical protein